MRRSVFGTTPESTSPTIVSLNDQKISATHSVADLNLCATIQKKSKVYCVLFFKLTCRIIYARLYSSLIQTEAAQYILEPRVRAQRIEARSQEHTRIKSFFIAFLEPAHRLILVPESCINHGNFRGARIDRIRPLLQITQELQRFVPSARCGV